MATGRYGNDVQAHDAQLALPKNIRTAQLQTNHIWCSEVWNNKMHKSSATGPHLSTDMRVVSERRSLQLLKSFTCVAKSMDEPSSWWAVVSGVGSGSQNKQSRGVMTLIPRCHPRQPPSCVLTVWRAGRAEEIWWGCEHYLQKDSWTIFTQIYYSRGHWLRGQYISALIWRRYFMLYANVPVKYAEVESEAEASYHTVVRLSHREVVNVISGQLLCCDIRAVFLWLVFYVLI